MFLTKTIGSKKSLFLRFSPFGSLESPHELQKRGLNRKLEGKKKNTQTFHSVLDIEHF